MTEAYEGLDISLRAPPPTLSVLSGIKSPPVSELMVALESRLGWSETPLHVASGVSLLLSSLCPGLSPVVGV